MINTKTRAFEAQLIGLVQQSGLPVCVARLCVASVLGQLTALESKAVEQEQAAKQEQTADVAASDTNAQKE